MFSVVTLCDMMTCVCLKGGYEIWRNILPSFEIFDLVTVSHYANNNLRCVRKLANSDYYGGVTREIKLSRVLSRSLN